MNHAEVLFGSDKLQNRIHELENAIVKARVAFRAGDAIESRACLFRVRIDEQKYSEDRIT